MGEESQLRGPWVGLTFLLLLQVWCVCVGGQGGYLALDTRGNVLSASRDGKIREKLPLSNSICVLGALLGGRQRWGKPGAF